MGAAPAAPPAAAAGAAAAGSSRPSSCNRFVFTRIQKGRQASGQHVFGGRSVLQGHGVLLFRNRPLGLRCGAVLRAWEQLQQHHQQQQEQQQQAQQLQSLCFYQNPEGTSSLGAACFWRSFRPSVAWCFGVAKGAFWRLAAPAPAAPLAWEQLQQHQQQQEQQQQQQPRDSRSFRPSGPWCFAVSQPPARTWLWSSSSSTTSSSSRSSSSSRPSSCNRFVFTRIQKGRQAACFWRLRPSGPWCFAVSQPPTRTSLWSCFEGMGAAPAAPPAAAAGAAAAGPAAAIALFFQNPEGTSSLGTACFWRSFRPSGPWCFAVSQPPTRTSLWSSSSSTTSSSRSSSSRPSSCNRFVFTRIQKGRQASGQHVFGGRSVLQ